MATCKTLLRPLLESKAHHHLFRPRPQIRHESTARRHKKLLTLPEAPSYTPTTPHHPTLIHNPPSSLPNVYHTPLKFLPANDRRRALYASFQATSTTTAHRTHTSPIATPGTPLSAPSRLPPKPSSALPDPVRVPYTKKYHLSPADIAEIQRLRAADPARWTRTRLAEKFGCSQFFVGMVAAHEGRRAEFEKQMRRVREGWGPRRREAREERTRRREGWGRDA